jgi:hypothetical protein
MTTTAAPPVTASATLSPGEEFARAYAADPAGAEVRFDYTITDAFQPTKERPRVTVRNLFRKRSVGMDPVRFWCEGRPDAGEAAAVHESGLRREAAFRFGTATAGVHPIRAWVRIPEELADDPEGLAVFIDYRLLVRLATAENQALTIGEHGLLRHPEIGRLPYRHDWLTGLLAACDEIEQTGATPHAMIVNPRDYYTHLLGRDALLADLHRNGVLISRTRMVAPGEAVVGDFAMAARLLDAGRSAIRVGTPPPGTFATDGPAVCAEIHEGLAVHLPTHFFHVVPA